ncbi:MAG TPA: DUF2892 domain-containing protein [Desulfomonilaceae bacterium]|nr:DUF2892 domain-containing protein [Desulfomonilaceae bacterium]
MMRDLLPDTSGRVERHTNRRINRQIREKIIADAFTYATKSEAEISVRIIQLDREWDTERVLESTAGILVLAGVLLGVGLNSLWLILAAVAALSLVQHSLQGWCLLLPAIRKIGVRTAGEIHEEKTALRIVRGDLDDIRPNQQSTVARAIH